MQIWKPEILVKPRSRAGRTRRRTPSSEHHRLVPGPGLAQFPATVDDLVQEA